MSFIYNSITYKITELFLLQYIFQKCFFNYKAAIDSLYWELI